MLKFHYYPTCSTLESGGVALCPIYDPADPVPTDRVGLLNAEGVVRGAVHNELCLTIPPSRMRRMDTMFVRDTHESLADANELRLSDLGYVAVSLSDASTTVNLGDVFVEYTIEFTSPRVGPRIGKCGRYSRETFATAGQGSGTPYSAPFGLQTIAEDRTGHSPGNTLMFDVSSNPNSYIDFDTGAIVNTNTVKFHEPFTGLMQYEHKTGSAPSGSGTNAIQVNGSENGWELRSGEEHKEKWGTADLINSVVSVGGTVMQLWKVAVAAGEVLDISAIARGAGVIERASLLFSDAAPALLDLLPALL